MKGVGRAYQFFNKFHNKPDLINFNDPKQNLVWSVFEGQLGEGVGHGFARILYADSAKSFIGYYNNGIKNGKGIQYYKSGAIQAEGLWCENDAIYQKKPITSFLENTDVAEDQKVLGSEFKRITVGEEADEMTEEQRLEQQEQEELENQVQFLNEMRELMSEEEILQFIQN